MKELIVDAKVEKLDTVLSFVDEFLEAVDMPMGIMMKVDIAVEELFVNIANYAYDDNNGKATIQIEENEDESVCISFIDSGKPYNPLEKEDPDVTLSAEERNIGGLGIFMVKKSMDNVEYKYVDGKNMLTITKNK